MDTPKYTAEQYRKLNNLTRYGQKLHAEGLLEAGLPAAIAEAVTRHHAAEGLPEKGIATSIKAGFYEARAVTMADAAVDAAVADLGLKQRRQIAALRNLARAWFGRTWSADVRIVVERTEYNTDRLVVVGYRNEGKHWAIRDTSQWFLGTRGGLSAVDERGKVVRGRGAVRAGKIG